MFVCGEDCALTTADKTAGQKIEEKLLYKSFVLLIKYSD